MKRALHLVFLLCVSLAMPTVLRGTHIVGGEITYRFMQQVGNKTTYRFTLRVYRDLLSANNTPFDNPARIAIYIQTASGYSLYGDDGNRRVLTVPLLNEQRLVNPSFPCLDPPTDVVVNEGIYEWNATLQDTNVSYVITYQRCCRNGTISNILNPLTAGSTYTVEITPEAQRVNNNSPTFKFFPPTVICTGEPINIDHSGKDDDGDQLIYRFGSALLGGGTNNPNPNTPSAPPYQLVTYRLPSYSFDKPLAGNPVVKIDPNTGQITGTPTIGGQFVVSIYVEEYRNGVLLSRVSRDFQFNVKDCKRQVVSAIQGDSTLIGKNVSLYGCEKSSLTIENKSYERANINSFIWTFTKNGDTTRYTDWSPTVIFPDTGTYFGRLTLNPNTPCSDSAFITVRIGGKVFPNFTTTYDSCVAGPVAFKNTTQSAVPIRTYIWDYGDGSTDTNKVQPQHRYNLPGLKNVNLFVRDIYGCKGDTSISFNWQPAPPILIVEPDNFVGCAPGKVVFKNRSTPIDTTYKIVWDFGDGTFGKDISPTHIYARPDTYSVKLQITSPIGCYKEATFRSWIKIKPVPKANFVWLQKTINILNPSVNLIDSSSADVISWRWYFGDNQGFSRAKNPVFTFKDTGFHQIKLFVNNFYGCLDSITKQIYIEPQITFHMPSAFSPNNDAVNDVFKGVGFLYGMRYFRMAVWNRWGEKVFETTDVDEGWNGQKNNIGDPVPSGVYMYEYELVTPKNERIVKRDFVTVYR